MNRFFKFICCLISVFSYSELTAQQPNGEYSLKELLNLAESNYPAIKAKNYQLQASEKQIAISKNSIMPSLDAALQTNLATHNNISGMSYPQFLLPISGPPSSDNSFNPVFGSAASLLFNWQAVTFGQRTALINETIASSNIQKADLNNEIFQHKVKIIEAYLDWLMAFDLQQVALENLERNRFNLKQSQTLVNSGIRPGVDTSLFSSELSKSRIEFLQMQQYVKTKSIQLEGLVNADASKILYDSSFLNEQINYTITTDTIINPLIALSKSYIDYAAAKKISIQRSANPRLTVWGTTYTRGSGITYNGNVDAVKGLLFSRYNYGAGVQLSVPLLKFKDVKLQLQQQEFIIQSNKENLAQTQLELSQQKKVAESTLQSTLAIAKETPLQQNAAELSFNALQSRYKAGLIDFSDLLQAQYNLAKAETDVKRSHLEVWKALLFKSAIAGDLNIFLNEVK